MNPSMQESMDEMSPSNKDSQKRDRMPLPRLPHPPNNPLDLKELPPPLDGHFEVSTTLVVAVEAHMGRFLALTQVFEHATS